MKFFFQAALLFLSLLLTFTDAKTCSRLGSPSPPLGYISAKTDKIFLGEVISKNILTKKIVGHKYSVQQIKFKVEQALKGIKNEIVEISFYEKVRGTSCNEPAPKPEPGEKWVIFRGYDEGDSFRRYVIDEQLLSFKYKPEEHKDILERLKNLTHNPPTVIYGQVTKYGALSWCPPIADSEVKITGEYMNLKTKTDAEGRYSFENIPPGKYKITINLPFKTFEFFMNWGSKKETIFDNSTSKHFYEHETSVGFRDAVYNYFVFSDKVQN